MKLGTLLVNSACLAFVSQAAANEKCGSSEPEPEALQAAAKLRDAQRAEGTPSRAALQRRDEGLLITTYVHVVEDQQHAGFVTDKMIDDQVWTAVIYSSSPGVSPDCLLITKPDN